MRFELDDDASRDCREKENVCSPGRRALLLFEQIAMHIGRYGVATDHDEI
jgi:hypothetical protein